MTNKQYDDMSRYDEATFAKPSNYVYDNSISEEENMRNRLYELHKLKVAEKKRIEELLK